MEKTDQFFQLPNIETGYELDKLGYFSVISPLGRRNKITNPSIETVTTGYTAVGGSIARSSVESFRGVYSLLVTPTAGVSNGVYYTTSSLVISTVYGFSCDVKSPGGMKMVIAIEDTVGNILAQKKFVASGAWQRVSVVGKTNGGGTHRVYLQKDNDARTGAIYTDGWMLEACASGEEFVTSYIDGDQIGYAAGDYYWVGAAHASESVRLATARHGGKFIKFSDMGMKLTSVIGLGIAPIDNISIPMGLLGGSSFQRTVPKNRQFSLVGQMSAVSYNKLKSQRRELIGYLNPDLSPIQQPLTLWYQGVNECGDDEGLPIRIPCSYQGGLEGSTDNLFIEKLGLSFFMYQSQLYREGEEGQSLGFSNVITNTGGITQDVDGNWAAWTLLGSGLSAAGQIYSILFAQNGYVYILGKFTTVNGVAAANVAYHDGTSWNAMTTGLTSPAFVQGSMTELSNGDIIIGGSFTSAGGIANTSGIAKWNGSAWSALGTGASGGVPLVFSLAQDSSGNVYAGGPFSLLGGVANTEGIALWNGAAWSALGTGATGFVTSIIFADDGNLYAGGSFTAMGGVANTLGIAKWNGTAWSALGTGGTAIQSIVFRDGVLYAGGTFTTIGGVSANRIAKWGGASWQALGSGANNTVTKIVFDRDGNLQIRGSFTTLGGFPVLTVGAQGVGIWNGSSYLPAPIPLEVIAIDSSLTQYYSLLTVTATVTSEKINTFNYSGNKQVNPNFVFAGIGTLQRLFNYTTGKGIFFNLTLQSNERAVLSLQNNGVTFKSNLRGNLLSTILVGSALSSFVLQHGDNVIGVLMSTTSGSPLVEIYTPVAEWSIDNGGI